MIRIGPAGWSYPDWEGRVWPRVKPRGFHALAFLARFVDCVEINSTFYALPRAEHARRWCQLVAEHPDFAFLVKLHRDFTHERRPEDGDAARALDLHAEGFRKGIEPLVSARRLSAVLVQFPVSFRFGADEVRRLGHLRALFDSLRLVLEVRHVSWFAPPALRAIRGLGYSLAWIDLPAAWNHPPDWHEPTGEVGYLRLHGRNAAQWFRRSASRDDRYDWLYAPEDLHALLEKARRIDRATGETYVVTNNHFAGQAVANALELAADLRGAPVDAPATLVRAFPRLAAVTRVVGQGELFPPAGE